MLFTIPCQGCVLYQVTGSHDCIYAYYSDFLCEFSSKTIKTQCEFILRLGSCNPGVHYSFFKKRFIFLFHNFFRGDQPNHELFKLGNYYQEHDEALFVSAQALKIGHSLGTARKESMADLLVNHLEKYFKFAFFSKNYQACIIHDITFFFRTTN